MTKSQNFFWHVGDFGIFLEAFSEYMNFKNGRSWWQNFEPKLQMAFQYSFHGMYFYSHFLILQYHVNIRTICIYLVACCILMFDVSSQEWPRAMGPSIKNVDNLEERGRGALCFVKGLYVDIQEVPAFCDFWFQRVIMKCGDQEFWGLFLV